MLLANTIRISQAPQRQYHQYFSSKQAEIYQLDGKTVEIHRENWLDLKEKKRG